MLGLPQLDLFEVAAGLAAELGTGAAEVVRSEAGDADRRRRPLHHIPHRPVAQGLSDPAALADAPEQPAVLDPGRGLPGVDGLLDPQRNGYRPDAPSLPHQIGQDPAALPQLDRGHVQGREFLPAQGAADQQTEDAGVALAFQGRAVRYRQQLFGLLAGEPVAQASSLLPDVGHFGEARRLVDPEHAVRPSFRNQLAHRREPDVDGGSGETIHAGLPLLEERAAERPTGAEAEEIVERRRVAAPGGGRCHGIEHHLAQPGLGRGQGEDRLFPGLDRRQRREFGQSRDGGSP